MTSMSSAPDPNDHDDRVVKINLGDPMYEHTGTGHIPTGNDYTFPPPADFLKLLSRHFNRKLETDATLCQEFGLHYQGAKVEFINLPTGYTVTKKRRGNDQSTSDYEIYGHFALRNRFFNSAPQFLEHAVGIMKLHLVDWLQLTPGGQASEADGLECKCVLCKSPTAEMDWVKRKGDKKVVGG
ncbi:hypothetical protein E4T42_07790 [Aureobasidium subglaciale]|nr:hypothetical protein E4T42_07790 [Aureobasidium subglaciale]